MRTIERVVPIKRNQMLRYLLDSVLACAGSLLVTGVLFVSQLYPRIPNIWIPYLLVVMGLAIVRGRYAAILSAVVAFLSLDYFIIPPLYNVFVFRIEEEVPLFIFLSVAMLTGHLAPSLRERESQVPPQPENRAQAQARERNAYFVSMPELMVRWYSLGQFPSPH